MPDENSHRDGYGKPWTVRELEIDEELIKASPIEPDGADQLAAASLGEFDALNPIAGAQAQRQAGEARLPTLKRNAERAAKHLQQTCPTRTIVTREKLAELPWFQIAEVGFTMCVGLGAIGISNGVIANYVVNGSDLYASDPVGARMFAGLAVLTALGLRAFEHFLPTDAARSRYALTLFGIGIGAFALWAVATAMTFAPNPNAGVSMTGATDDRWTGIVLVLAHIVGDAAWGYVLLAGAEKVLLGNRERVELANPHHAKAKAQAKRADAALAACLGEIAEAEDYIAAVAHARTALQGRLELLLDGKTALWRAQQDAGAALARAQFLNPNG